MKKRSKIGRHYRASAYILFAATSNIMVAIGDDDPKDHPDIAPIMTELARKLKIWYMNEKLVKDYERDVTKVMKGLTGYETSQPLMLALSILIHYREWSGRKIELSGDLWKQVYYLDALIHDVEIKNLKKNGVALIKKSVEAGDLIVSGIVRYVEDNY